MAATRDLPAPRGGPPFLRLSAWPYRLEYALGTVAVLLVLFGGRLGIGLTVSWSLVGQALFWFLWPDLAAFIPIGIGSRGGQWPWWGALWYNLFHSLAVWLAVFVVWMVITGAVPWPLLGWAAHITADRAVGYHLRATVVRDGSAPVRT